MQGTIINGGCHIIGVDKKLIHKTCGITGKLNGKGIGNLVLRGNIIDIGIGEGCIRYDTSLVIIAIKPQTNEFYTVLGIVNLDTAVAVLRSMQKGKITVFAGKEISGIGMDSNVTGRHRDIVGDFFTPPHARRIFVRNLSPESDGNANGIGLADVTTKRLVDAIDFKKTYQNALTAISPEKAAVPIHFETDRECLATCLNTIGMVEPDAARIVRIRNTAALETMWISRALEAEAMSNTGIQVLGSWERMSFDDAGNLVD